MSPTAHSNTYTPGPLTVSDKGLICRVNQNGYQEPVKLNSAWQSGAWESDTEARANAVLYAASPDLLACLLAAMPFVSAVDSDEARAVYRTAADVISRAVGRS